MSTRGGQRRGGGRMVGWIGKVLGSTFSSHGCEDDVGGEFDVHSKRVMTYEHNLQHRWNSRNREREENEQRQRAGNKDKEQSRRQ